MTHFRFHWQNLNEKPGNREGSPLRHGRAWLRALGLGINWEWGLFRHQCVGVTFTVTQSEEVGFHMSLGVPFLFSFYVTVYGGLFTKAARWLLNVSKAGYDDREMRLSFHDAAIWWEVWRDSGSWSSSTPRWRSGNFSLDNFVLGRAKYYERVLREQDVIVPMPERGYAAHVRLFESTWMRPRWFSRRLLRAEVKIPGGIPFPGKGENSWDCGEDAMYGLACQAETVEQAIARVVESVLRSRRRYGGSVGWKPEKAEVTA